jgi:phosphoesterase RecJ-like protein
VPLPERFHLAVLDCGALARIGTLAQHAERACCIVNIDHHFANSRFGDINYVDSAVSSCGELVYRILAAGGAPITREVAECLYTAILTDTGRFSYSNVSAESFAVCAKLVAAGCNPCELSNKIYHSPPETAVRLRGLAIGTLHLEAGGRLAVMEITREMFERTGARPVDTKGFADIPVSVKGVVASALLKEMPGPERGGAVSPGAHKPRTSQAPAACAPWVKVSLRSRAVGNAVDVCAVAESFGGGGHRHAAGFKLEGGMPHARSVVVEALRGKLD